MQKKINIEKIVNRHIARLINRLEPLDIPDIAKETIVKEMWFLSNDLTDYYVNREVKNGLG